MTGQAWSWALSTVGVSSLYLAGTARTRAFGWALGLLTQCLWFTYGVATAQWGFLASALAYSFVCVRNLRCALRERKAVAVGESG